MIFEDFSRFILVENIYEEVVLHSVMKDIMMGQFHLVPGKVSPPQHGKRSVCVCVCAQL